MTGEGLLVAVADVTQSPMNERRWCLELSCGHDLYVTAESKPKRRSATCPHPSHSKGPHDHREAK